MFRHDRNKSEIVRTPKQEQNLDDDDDDDDIEYDDDDDVDYEPSGLVGTSPTIDLEMEGFVVSDDEDIPVEDWGESPTTA